MCHRLAIYILQLVTVTKRKRNAINMRLSLNKTTYGQMPEQVASIVKDWQARYGKRHISVETRPSFYVSEDARYTAINLLNGAQASGQAAGEFAGHTGLAPSSVIAIPEGVVFVETGFFCGVPHLTVYQGTNAQQLAA